VPQFACKRGVPYEQADADIVGPAVLEVVRECGGAIDKDDILAAARDRNSPLHQYIFNKSQRDAAEAYYRRQAGKLMRSFEVTWTQGGQPRRADLLYYVELVQPADENDTVGGGRHNRTRRRGHVTVDTVMDDSAYQQQILARMQQDLAVYQRRYEEFTHIVDFSTNFGRVFRGICRLFEDTA